MNSLLKLCIVSQKYPLLSQTFVWRQVQHFDAAVLAEDYYHGLLEQEPANVFVLNQNTPREKLYQMGKKGLARLGLMAYHQWPKLWQQRALLQLKAWQSQVVLAHFGQMGNNLLPVCQQAGLPLVVFIHGMDASSLLRIPAYRRQLAGTLASPGVWTVASSTPILEHLHKSGIRPRQATVIHPGVPLDAFPYSSPPSGKVRFLSVGRLTEKKAPLLVVKAFEEARRLGAEAELRMVGEGPLRQALDELVVQSPYRQDITLLGALPNEKVREQMQACSVFLQHSITPANGDREGWPVSIAEACATGRAVIATRHSGIADQVLDNQSGFLVEEGDWPQMGRRMAELAKDAEKVVAMGEASRRHIEQTGSLQEAHRRLEGVFTKALA